MQLKKGKYLLTMSFLVRTVQIEDESYMYIYLNKNEFIQYGGFYSPAPNKFLPCTLEKMYEVGNEGESISISTNCGGCSDSQELCSHCQENLMMHAIYYVIQIQSDSSSSLKPAFSPSKL